MQQGLKDYLSCQIIIGSVSGIDAVAELFDKAVAGVVVELGIAIEEKGNEGIDRAKKGGSIDALPVLHVAVIVGGQHKNHFKQLLLFFPPFFGSDESIAGRR